MPSPAILANRDRWLVALFASCMMVVGVLTRDLFAVFASLVASELGNGAYR